MKLALDADYGFTRIVDNSDDLPPWDQFRLNKIREIFTTCPKIIDFGNSSRSLAVLFEDELAGKLHLSLDINPVFRPNITADICDLPLETDSIDGVICAAILEHVYNPFGAAAELHRILKPGGKLFIYVPWMYRYHGNNEYDDFYRYSRDGLRYMLRDFSHLELCPVRGHLETILNFVPRFSKRSKFIKYFGTLIQKFDEHDDKHTSGFNVYAIK
ncbi:MAG: methyltransferase domain-containing protein [Anaerolineaceae bacterium]|nr:methyltransferase domain-containing protein [Anaerolineaceae bacterium]MCB9102230.1 methyltransferase domain-containing protein [Anaerolineales bacterium]